MEFWYEILGKRVPEKGSLEYWYEILGNVGAKTTIPGSRALMEPGGVRVVLGAGAPVGIAHAFSFKGPKTGYSRLACAWLMLDYL